VGKTPESLWDIQRLDLSHDRISFDCGKPSLNDWLQCYAGQYERRDLARSYVAVLRGESKILGYYAISAHQVGYESLPRDQAKGMPTIDIPVVLIGRLAVDKTTQGRGLGSFLLIDVLRRIDHLSREIGIRAVEVHAIDDDAHRFYRKYGFTSLADDKNHLFLPIQTIRKIHLPPS
jgi:GNAT superfamily N-acetyltransferase